MARVLKRQLFDKVKNKLGTKDGALRKRVERKANILGISTEAALALIAKELKIGTVSFDKKLTPAVQDQIRFSLRAGKSPSFKGSDPGIQKSVVRTLRLQLGEISNVLVPPQIVRDAKETTEKAYPILYVFENSIRYLIKTVMDKEFGDDWWDRLMDTRRLQEIKKEVEKRMSEEKRKVWHGKRGAHPLFYTDFDHLIYIIGAKRTVFNKYFKDTPAKAGWLIAKLEEIKPSRNIVDHHNPLSATDLARLSVHFMDWNAVAKGIMEEMGTGTIS